MGLLPFKGFRLKKYMNLAGSCIAMVNGECRAQEGRHTLVSESRGRVHTMGHKGTGRDFVAVTTPFVCADL